jgi:hypothetical protein
MAGAVLVVQGYIDALLCNTLWLLLPQLLNISCKQQATLSGSQLAWCCCFYLLGFSALEVEMEVEENRERDTVRWWVQY